MSLKFPLKFKSETGEKRSEVERFLDALQLANHGWFPFARNHSWHGGVHITSEMGGGDTGLQVGGAVNAIGKGEVVAFRMQEGEKPKDDKDAKIPYSTGFVLIKHKYELPADKGKKPETVDYFSLYMHMRKWKGYKGTMEIPAFLDTGFIHCYVIKGAHDITAFGKAKIDLLKGSETDIAKPAGKIMGTNIRSGETGKTVTGFPEKIVVYAIPLNKLPASKRPKAYKTANKRDKDKALIVRIDENTIPHWYNTKHIPKDGIVWIKTGAEVTEKKAERRPNETPKIAKVDKHPAQTGFKFDEVIVCNPPIPVESSSALGYLGHWDQKKLMHFEIFCGGSDKAKIIEKGQVAAPKDKQKSKTFIKKGTALYQHIPVPKTDISFSKLGETKTGGVYYSGANAIKLLETDGDYEKWQHVGEYRAKNAVVAKKAVKQYEIVAGAMQTFWMKKGIPTQKEYGKSKHADADFFTRQDIKGWSAKPLDEIIPDASKNMKTVPYDLYSKKTGKSVTFQKNKYSELILRQQSCDKSQPYTAYVKDKDTEKYSKHDWKDFTSIKESNPASIGVVAKEELVKAKAQEINAVPALGYVATDDDDLSVFAKEILKKIELHKIGEEKAEIHKKEHKTETEEEKKKCLINGYRKLQHAYKCEDQRTKLMRLVCRHPTEWRDLPNKPEILKLTPAQTKQIKALSWWDEASGVKGLPEPQNVWHFHPAGFIGNLSDVCQIDEHYFFTKYKKEFNLKSLSDVRKDSLRKMFSGISEFLTEHTEYKCSKKKVAYMLATAKHETAHTFNPITEYGGKSYFNRYDPILANTQKRKDTAIANENTKEGDGYKYRGRGFVQLTWKKNYRMSGDYLGLDLVNNPELALDHTNAIKIMIYGMETGLFTSKKFSHYITETKTDYYNARRIINGTDKATTIKGYAEKIEKCIRIN